MKFLYKYAYWLAVSLVLGLLVLFGIGFHTPGLPELYIESSYGTEKICIHEGADGTLSVFLPSYAEMKDVKFRLPARSKATLNGAALANGSSCSGLETEIRYELITAGESRTLTFYRSANVAAMFIDTASGRLDYIHRDKNYEEQAALTVYRPDGSIDSSGSANIKGRGNSTWLYDKKPYSLSFSAAAQLLSMPPALNWALLANATDSSNLHNKLVYDMTLELWPEAGHSSEWLDLYINGEYKGLYLLTEKVESGENRLDINTYSGDFLCKIELSERLGQLRNGFVSSCGRAVEICEPRDISEAESRRIQELVRELEQAIVSGGDLSQSEIIDLDSWARRYITDEIAANVDSDKASGYFYYKDGKFYAGPVWDFDLSFGNNLGGDMRYSEPAAFVARPHAQFSSPGSSYYRALCENESFMGRVREIYAAYYAPYLKKLCSGELDALSVSLEDANRNNALRWSEEQSVMTLCDYLSSRENFLSSMWIDGETYHSVYVDSPEMGIRFFAVKDGENLEALVPSEGTKWLNAENGMAYELSAAVREDVYIYAAAAESTAAAPETSAEKAEPGPALTIREKLTVLSIGAMLLATAVFLGLDMRQRQQERRQADAKPRSKIPS